jgi:hypothetical protein
LNTRSTSGVRKFCSSSLLPSGFSSDSAVMIFRRRGLGIAAHGLDAPVEQVHKGVGLADAQRQAEHDVAFNRGEHVLHRLRERGDDEGACHALRQAEGV